RRQWQQSQASPEGEYTWSSGPWPVRRERLFLLPGDSPVGLRLPLETLPWTGTAHPLAWTPIDPFQPRSPLPRPVTIQPQRPAVSPPPSQTRPERIGYPPLEEENDLEP
ncbi:MAG: transglutaminase family protein, partial [Pirellulaceae bacterium]